MATGAGEVVGAATGRRGDMKMLNARKSTIWVIAGLLALCSGMAAQAAGPAKTWKHSTLEAGRYRVKEVMHPLTPQSITQNVDPNTIVAGTSVACVGAQTTDTGWWRLYDISAFNNQFCTKNVDYGVETAVGPTQNITANVFCLDNGLPFLTVFLVLAGTNSQPQPDADLAFFNVPVTGCCDTQTQQMAVELLSDNCQETGTCQTLFIGCNDLGQTAPSYITADDCGVIDPVDMALIGFPDSHVIQVVNGNDESDGGGDECYCCGCGTPHCDAVCGPLPCIEICGDVPATTGPGTALTILALLVTSTLVLRRVWIHRTH